MQTPIDMPQTLRELDRRFAENDLAGAGEYLDAALSLARKTGDTAAVLSLRSEQVGYFRKTGEKEKALEAIDEALRLCDMLQLRSTITGATVLLNCATTYKAFGQSARALPLYREAEALYAALLPKNDYRMAGLYNNFALALCDLAQYPQALALYEKALAVLQALGENECDLGVTYVNMAHLFEKMQQEQNLEAALSHAYDALMRVNPARRDGYFAFCCDKCAPSFQYFGWFLQGNRLARCAEEGYARQKEKNKNA